MGHPVYLYKIKCNNKKLYILFVVLVLCCYQCALLLLGISTVISVSHIILYNLQIQITNVQFKIAFSDNSQIPIPKSNIAMTAERHMQNICNFQFDIFQLCSIFLRKICIVHIYYVGTYTRYIPTLKDLLRQACM